MFIFQNYCQEQSKILVINKQKIEHQYILPNNRQKNTTFIYRNKQTK